jgi:hypothetical protein
LYERVHRALNSLPNRYSSLHIDDISIVDPKKPVIALIRSAISTPLKALSSIRFTQNAINGQFIEDALIYRST